jgi:SAM-dependent methyltransferase
MGIARPTAKLLLREAARRSYQGSCLTLGRQDIQFGYSWLQAAARSFGVPLCPVEVQPHRQAALAARGFMSDESFLRALGFSETVRLDCSDYEAPEELLDLNSEALPAHLKERFDVVLDAGTLEHVFHVPNALRNLFGMVKVGGRIIHFTPSSNHIDHGFYMVSPTLFWDFYSANQFELNAFHLYRYTPSNVQWEIYEYSPGRLVEDVMWGGLDSAMYGVFAVATRTDASTGDRIPQQGWYLHRWREAKRLAAAQGDEVEPEGSKARRLLDLTRGNRLLHALARRAIDAYRVLGRWRRKWRRKGLGLKAIARY